MASVGNYTKNCCCEILCLKHLYRHREVYIQI